MRSRGRGFGLALLAASWFGCGDSSAAPKPPLTEEEVGVNYQGDIRPLLEANCVSCHVEGGVAPFALDDVENVETYQALIVSEVLSGVMPPWPIDDDCHPLRDVRALDDETLAVFEAWRDNEFALGREEFYEAPERIVGPDLGEPNIVMEPDEPYVADLALTDDYRCFVMTDSFERDTFVTGIDILPGVRETVHHVQIHTIPAAGLEEARANDAASEGPGYTCFGGVMVTGSYNMFSWRPGSSIVSFDEGDAAFIEKDTAVVIQVHYNTQWLKAGEEPAPDLTKIAFWTLPEGEQPDYVVTRRGATALALSIPPGRPDAKASGANPALELSAVGGSFMAGEIVGMTPHMHNLGIKLDVKLTRPDGTEECLVNVDEWAFEWQFDYMYRPDAYVAVGPDDVLTVTCMYDNSPEHQPVINGEQLQPRYVTWGEGSLDEMCLNYVWFRYPREAYFAR